MREAPKRADEEGFTAVFVRRPVLAVVINALIIVALIPLALRGIRYRPAPASAMSA